MNHLAYVPSKKDKAQLYKEIAIQEDKNKQQLRYYDNQIDDDLYEPKNKKLTSSQLSDLLLRLVKHTKKQYEIQQQTTHIRTVNEELMKRRKEGDKVQNRLIQQGKKNQQKKVELGKQLELQNKQKYYRDIPAITAKAKHLKQTPIDRRLDEVIADRITKRQQLNQKYLPQFVPAIDAHSQFINDLQNYGDLQNRMEVREQQAHKRKKQLSRVIQQKQKEMYTFKPVLNQKSKDIAEGLTRRPLSSHTIAKTNSVSILEEEMYPFAPQINKNTEQLLKKHGQHQESSCFTRLYKQAKQMVQKQQVKQKQSVPSFRPSLNNRSLKIASSISKRQNSRHSITKQSELDQQYQQIRLGYEVPLSCQSSRIKAFSVRDECQSQPLNLRQKCSQVLYRSGKLRAVQLR